MILNNQPNKPVEKMPALILRQSINLLRMMPNCKNALPARNGISPDNWMDGSKLVSHILGRAYPWRFG